MNTHSLLPAWLLAAAISATPLFGQEAAKPAPVFKPVTIERDATGTVTIKNPNLKTMVRYTLDGTDPIAKSGPYLAPIELPFGGTIKLRVVSDDRAQLGDVITEQVEAPKKGTRPFTTLVPVTQDRDWPIYDWAKRHHAVSSIVHARHPKVIFIGDSITQMFGGEPHDRKQPGTMVWDEFYSQRNVANLGFGYDRVENTLWRLQHGELEDASPNAVVLLLGTNNLGLNTPEEIAAGVRAVCTEIRRHCPSTQIILMAILPRSAKPEDAVRAKLKATNQLLAQLQEPGKITYLDIGDRLLEPDGTITREMMGDFLHPTAKGYRIWAEALEPVLRPLLGEPAQ